MSERMWISEQLEQARTERDQARLDLAALKGSPAPSITPASMSMNVGNPGGPLPAYMVPDPAEAMRAKCEAIAREYAEDIPTTQIGYGMRFAAHSIAYAIAALKDGGEGK